MLSIPDFLLSQIVRSERGWCEINSQMSDWKVQKSDGEAQ